MHLFLFKPGLWLGQGIIRFSMAEDELKFYARWSVEPIQNEKIQFVQEIEINGFTDKMLNTFVLSDLTSNKFAVQIQNNLVGTVVGTGVIDDNAIAWEFRNSSQAFEGYEIYERKVDGSYNMRSEFFAGDGFRTIIQGSLWPKVNAETPPFTQP